MEDSLYKIIHTKKEFLKDVKMYKIATSIARGMEFLHSINIIHRDLKSANVLISNFSSNNPIVKISDFGLSRTFDEENPSIMTGNIGTPQWAAPEILQQQPYTEKCDVYSFAVVLWELQAKKIPYENINRFEIPIKVTEGERPEISKECPKQLRELIQLCWKKSIKKRPSFTQIIYKLSKIAEEEGKLGKEGKENKKRSTSRGIKI